MIKSTSHIQFFLPLLASLMLNLSCLRALLKEDKNLLSIDTTSFILLHDEHGFSLRYGQKTPLQIPQEWLVPKDEAPGDTQYYVSSFNYDGQVTSFPIINSLIGLHLSSYEIQKEGSAQAAAGRDVFLVYNKKERRLHQGKLFLGISKERVRFMGCPYASFLRFVIGDINKDSSTDIGIIREEIKCEETCDVKKEVELLTGPFYEKSPIIWYVFAGHHWTQKLDYKGQYPNRYAELPLISLKNSPVDIVKKVYQKRIKERSPGDEKISHVENRTIVLPYSDFGPQVLAHELVGYEWYQWDSVGDGDPNTKYDVKVIVYKDITLQEVQKHYSVNKEKIQDYRYVEFNEAIKYFNRHIKAFADLKKTDSKIFVESGANKLLSDFQITRREIDKLLNQ